MSHVSAAKLFDSLSELQRLQSRTQAQRPATQSFAEIAQAQQNARAMGLQAVRPKEWPKSKVDPRKRRDPDEQQEDSDSESATDRPPRQSYRRVDVSV